MLPHQRKYQHSRRFAPRRRHRLTIVCSVCIAVMLLLFIRNSWDDSYSYTASSYTRPQPVASENNPLSNNVVERPKPAPSVPETKAEPAPAELSDAKLDEYIAKQEEEDLGIKDPVPEVKEETPEIKEEKEEKTEPADDIVLPNKAKVKETDTSKETEEVKVEAQNPPNDETNKAILDEPKVHWKPLPEHFPVNDDELIQLPTGMPGKIPKIQYDFGTEVENDQVTRTQRLKRVKTEIERAWGGYKKFAWMHDELSPVSAKYRDPFCGWAATLVDSLDTLWIAGLKEEFDEAAKAVKDIDFTFTTRNEIPVFETTIRYLGGLLAAFDVSGGHKGKYAILLQKAVELAEILMGIFDTPNRMPSLYYNWKPEHASQPRRAGRVGIAELGTLSMEFTRLAQLTSEHKYYDAVDRITNGLVKMQEDYQTQIPGLFPENIDISGCNRTATTLRDSLSKDAQKQLDSVDTQEEPEGYVPTPSSSDGEIENEGSSSSEDDTKPNSQFRRRDSTDEESGDDSKNFSSETVEEETSMTTSLSDEEHPPPFAADGRTAQWDCVPQGFVPSGWGYSTFHMGGGQDSAYEYFPKEWLLLGGLEHKYQKLYEDSVEAINEWLLFRPMAGGDDWDVLFPAKISTNGDPAVDMIPQFEITHLTCFIGGMYGLGGKIFGREQDVEIAKKLTDGCVWAYQSMPSGLMPESSHVLPCPDLEKCEFNETLWWGHLDQSKEWRDKEIARWEESERLEKQSSLQSNNKDDPIHQDRADSGSETESPKAVQTPKIGGDSGDDTPEGSKENVSSNEDEPTDSSSTSLRKRAAIPVEDEKAAPLDDGSELPESLRKKLGYEIEEEPKASKVNTGDDSTVTPKINEDDDSSDPEIEKVAENYVQDDAKPSIPDANMPGRIKPQKPLSHEEYVKQRIEENGLAPGFLDIPNRSYILRPEAIESVWYMYRITGDPEWMEKGWRMFEATVQATRTQFANSAIDDVTRPEPGLKDEMESFWLAETLKYYFLLFSEPDVISLDEWVLNTEAHPFRRPI